MDRTKSATGRISVPGQDGTDTASDGRAARRDRNRLAAIDAAIELFSEDNLQPSMEEIALRSGISGKSVRRYFEDSKALLSAAIERQLELGYSLYWIHAVGEGPLDHRIESFVSVRLEAHQVIAATARAAAILAAKSTQVRMSFDRVRVLLREQIEVQFANELRSWSVGKREARVAAIDALVQFESLDYFRLRRGFTLSRTQSILIEILGDLLHQ
jgi:AcrR family transcriptional regulator